MPTNQDGRGLNAGGIRAGGLRRVSRRAPGVQIIDSHEDGDILEYQDYEQSGGITAYDVVASSDPAPQDGDYILQLADDTGYPKILSTSGLEAYPSQGDEWRIWVNPSTPIGSSTSNEGSGDIGVYFAAADFGNTYYVNVRPYEDSARIYEKDGGTSVAHDNAADIGMVSGEWYEVIVQWDDGSTFGGTAGDISVEVQDEAGTVLASLFAAAADFTTIRTGGGYGHYGAAGTGNAIYWDFGNIPISGDTTSTTIESFESASFTSYNAISDGGMATFGHTDAKSETEPIGGGPGYSDTVAQSAATYTVSNSDDLRSAANAAVSDEIIYVTGNISTVGEQRVDIPAGVILAGDRGIDGSPGPIIYCGKRNKGLYFEDGARCTGLRVEGPWPDRWSPSDKSDDDWHQKGVNFTGDGGELDNCEIYGFGYSCVQATNDGGTMPYGLYIHHNNIHHGISKGWGYGIDTYHSVDTHIEYNRFGHCRHSITNAGDGSYKVRHNIHEEPHTHNIVDMHQMGGVETDVLRNTIVTHQTDIDGLPNWNSSNKALSGYIQREAPDNEAHIRNNWMWNPHPPPTPPNEGFSFTAIDQAWPETGYPGEWQGVRFHDNTYGPETRAPDNERAPDGRRCRDEGERALVYYGSRSPLGYLSTSGLDTYPSAGDSWRFFFRPEGWPFGLAQIFFGVQDDTQTQDYYEIELRRDEIALEVDVGGTDTRLGSAGFGWDSMIPYEIVVDWPSDPTNNGITITVTNWYSGVQVASFTATADDTYTTGGIGFYGNSWSGFLLDDFEII